MIKLKVPLLRQKKGSLDCGIISLEMILKYYGDDVSFEELKKTISVDKVGTYAPQLGSYLLGRGYSVKIVTFHPSLFTSRHRNMSQKSVKAHLRRLFSSEKDSQKKKVLGYFLDFLKQGGEILVDIPDASHVRKELVARRPVGALLTTNFLSDNSKSVFNFHFNVITGITEKTITVNDPLWDSRGGEHTYKQEDFFFGLYASAYGDLDNASLMLIKKR